MIGNTLRSEPYSYILSFSITYSTMVNIFSHHGESSNAQWELLSYEVLVVQGWNEKITMSL